MPESGSVYRPRLLRNPVGIYAALVADGSCSAWMAAGGTASACSLPLIGRRVVIGIVVASCCGGRSCCRPDRDAGRDATAGINSSGGNGDAVVAATIVSTMIGATVIAISAAI